jgi:menaquinone-dependent protoporphyrinogen oxidase
VKILKVCIIYDTKRGSTKQIAEWMKEGLMDARILVDLKKVDRVDNFAYDLFVIGSPIYWEKPLKSVVNFLSENKDKFKGKKVAVFVVCLAKLFGHFTDRHVKNHYLKPLEEEILDSLVKRGVFKGWLKKPDYNEKKNVIKWIREVVQENKN